MIYCQKCGQENSEGADFCRRCGMPLILNLHEALPQYETYPTYAYVEKKLSLDVTTLALGIVSVVLFWFCWIWELPYVFFFIGLMLSIVGLVLSNKYRNVRNIAPGLVISVIGLILNVIMIPSAYLNIVYTNTHYIEVPNIEGLYYEDAMSQLSNLGFGVKAEFVHPSGSGQTVYEGMVIEQDPVAGSWAKSGYAIKLKVVSQFDRNAESTTPTQDYISIIYIAGLAFVVIGVIVILHQMRKRKSE